MERFFEWGGLLDCRNKSGNDRLGEMRCSDLFVVGLVKPSQWVPVMTNWGGVSQQKGRSEERPDFVYAAGV